MSHYPLFLAIASLGSPSTDEAAGAHQTETAAQPVLYVTATAHLDTQWLWTIQTTIDEYIPNTLRDNFALFEKFPHYLFSFEGSFRYMLAKEYYPQDYARLKDYVAQGRWHVCGSSVDAGDVNLPSPESLIRQVLYGNLFFEREFGRRSCDIYLPDCFGFGYALPTIAAHCGLKGFSTQKLTWGSSVGIPFDVGVWEGVDGSSVIAALNPGAYVSKLRSDLSTDAEWLERINKLGGDSGAYVGYKYFGVGDVGGAPDDESVQWLEQAVAAGRPVRVLNAPADQLYRDLTPEQIARLPRYKGEMLMTRHGTGCYTSQAAMKRWNRKNELLADAAERASMIADWLGRAPYPRAKFEEAWVRFLWHQFHDDLTGTSIPQAYTFSWNDEIIALNQFAAELTHAVGAVAHATDTRVEGVPLVVFNPLGFDREDVIEATVSLPSDASDAVRVYDASGAETPSQVTAVHRREADIVFLARVPSVGFAVYDVRPSASPCSLDTGLRASDSGLENQRYRLRLDANGDVASLYDKSGGRELLARPARLQLLRDAPRQWSEWEVEYRDVSAEPYAHVGGPAEVRVVEQGPARATIELRRHAAGSTFTQRIRLGGGEAGDRIEFENVVDWRTPLTLLKAAFPFTVSNPTATYDLGCGVIERANNTEPLYEVPAQQWADLTATDGSFGAAVLNDCKYGWDKPQDDTLRLTLIHAPNDVEKDMGWHRFTYALCGHAGDWRQGQVVRQAARLNQPLMAFRTTAHPGPLGNQLSLLKIGSPQVVVRALKKAETTDELIVRLQEAHGLSAAAVDLELAAPVLAAREVTGAEQPLETPGAGPEPAPPSAQPPPKPHELIDGGLRIAFRPFQLRTFALTLGPPPTAPQHIIAQAVPLPFDRDGVSSDHDMADGDFDGAGHTLPAELLPGRVVCGGVPFTLGPTDAGRPNAVVCRGQTLPLPQGDFNRLYLLAAAAGGRASGAFAVGDRSVEITVGDFSGWIGQSDSLVVDGEVVGAADMAPGFIHRDEVAWVGTHRHDGAAGRNEPYVFCYLFKYGVEVPPGASTMTLPRNEQIRIMAATVANHPYHDTTPAHPLYDRIDAARITPHGGLFIEPVTVRLASDVRGAQVVYTLDGREPTTASTRYDGPFQLDRDATVSARALTAGKLDERVTRASFAFTRPRSPENPPNVKPGIGYRYYEGEWARLPDFESLTPSASGVTTGIDVSRRARDDRYGFVYEGYISIERNGVYTFFTASDDGSRLYIGDREVVDNDGLHGTRERLGPLAAGLHAIRVTFFESGGDDELHVRYRGPGIDKQVIPSSVLYHGDARPIEDDR